MRFNCAPDDPSVRFADTSPRGRLGRNANIFASSRGEVMFESAPMRSALGQDAQYLSIMRPSG